MTILAPSPGAEAAPVAVDCAEPHRRSFGALVYPPMVTDFDFPAWSSLSWDERADYIARHCL